MGFARDGPSSSGSLFALGFYGAQSGLAQKQTQISNLDRAKVKTRDLT